MIDLNKIQQKLEDAVEVEVEVEEEEVEVELPLEVQEKIELPQKKNEKLPSCKLNDISDNIDNNILLSFFHLSFDCTYYINHLKEQYRLPKQYQTKYGLYEDFMYSKYLEEIMRFKIKSIDLLPIDYEVKEFSITIDNFTFTDIFPVSDETIYTTKYQLNVLLSKNILDYKKIFILDKNEYLLINRAQKINKFYLNEDNKRVEYSSFKNCNYCQFKNICLNYIQQKK